MPATVIEDAGIEAVSCAAETKVVVTFEPANVTWDAPKKPEPLSVSVRPAAPAVALVGEMEFRTGTGLVAVNV